MTAIGIDLGTSNTVVAHFKNGAPRTLADTAGRRLIPSIVSFHPSGTVLVGDSAKMRRFNDGANTVTGAKRLMGRTWGTPELEEMRKRLPFQLREGKNKTVRALLRGELYSIPELSAFVLRKAKAWAEEALGEKVTQAVITVPANFHELQRQATKLAGELAGLEVMRVLNEPTAAALAYGHIAPARKDEQVAVYDFGGGTFDLTMLTMSERELRVKATAGDMFLGGDDIDLAIAAKIADAYLAKNFYDPRADPDVFARVRVAAERLKVELSTEMEASVPLNELMYGAGGKPIMWSFRMTRRELEAILDPFIDQSLKVCREALGLLKASPREFDRIVLVGGTTLSPRIRQRVAEFFGKEPVVGIDPEEAVALGAAISGTMPVARKSKSPATTPRTPPPPRPQAAGRGMAAPAALPEIDLEPDVVYPIRESFRPPPVPGRAPPVTGRALPVAAVQASIPAARLAATGGPRPTPPKRGGRRWVWVGVGAGVALIVVGALGLRHVVHTRATRGAPGLPSMQTSPSPDPTPSMEAPLPSVAP